MAAKKHDPKELKRVINALQKKRKRDPKPWTVSASYPSDIGWQVADRFMEHVVGRTRDGSGTEFRYGKDGKPLAGIRDLNWFCKTRAEAVKIAKKLETVLSKISAMYTVEVRDTRRGDDLSGPAFIKAQRSWLLKVQPGRKTQRWAE